MKEAAPFLVFALFVGLIWARNRGRPREAATGEPAPAGPGVRRLVLGNPPVDSPVDAFTRFGVWVAWLLGLVAIVGGVAALLAPAGALLAVIGVLYVSNAGGVRERLEERERRSAGYRIFGMTPSVRPFFGVAMTFVGLVWLAAGVLALAG